MKYLDKGTVFKMMLKMKMKFSSSMVSFIYWSGNGNSMVVV